MTKKATIKDIAAETGLSAATVSLVLNGKAKNIPESTCTRVKEVAKNLNYSPDFAARSLVTGKTQTIGVIIPDISNSFFAEMVRHLQLEFDDCGYDVILCNSEEKMAKDKQYLGLLASGRVDGLVLTMSAESMQEENVPAIVEILNSLSVPFVFFDRYVRGDFHKVIVDNELSGRQIANHLLSLGHRKIGVITGPISLNSTQNRLKGFLEELAAHNVVVPNDCIVQGDYGLETGKRGAEALFKKDVTAIFAFNDLQAYGVAMAAKECGKNIPQDVGLVGFDDSLYSSMSETKFTTMRQPLKELAQKVCKTLTDLLQGNPAEKEIKLQTQLIIRDSVRKL